MWLSGTLERGWFLESRKRSCGRLNNLPEFFTPYVTEFWPWPRQGRVCLPPPSIWTRPCNLLWLVGTLAPMVQAEA